MTVPDFLRNADALRETFDENFSDTRKLHSGRFCWDYWHIPGQYTQLRTPAQDYFEESDYSVLEATLLDFGKEKLGCIGITPIWLSYYVDGCRQELHCDNVHGPWAFVVSLTDWESRKFIGGETSILTEQTLSFWREFSVDTRVEQDSLVRLIEPKFNQLTVFDPRLPHGVREVRGVQDPVESRIVLHGWFVEPELFVEGYLTFDDATAAFEDCMSALTDHLPELPEATGTLVLRITIDPEGGVKDIVLLTDTLVPRPWDVPDNDLQAARNRILSMVLDVFSSHSYPACSGKSTITAPILFE